MRNWNVYFIMSAIIITIILFADKKVSPENMLSGLQTGETLIVFLKSIAITLVTVVSLLLMIVILLADVLVTIVTGKEFPLTQLMYDNIYIQLLRGWYWDAHSGSHIFMACIIMFGLGLISLYIAPLRRKKKFIYYSSRKK